jgi:hypothetical protein
MRRRRKYFPFPEAIDRKDGTGPWDVREGPGGAVCPEKRQMTVTLRGDDVSRYIRCHEMAHVRYSPDTVSFTKAAGDNGVSTESLQVAEDARIQFNMKHIHRITGASATQEQYDRTFTALLERMDFRAAIRFMVSGMNSELDILDSCCIPENAAQDAIYELLQNTERACEQVFRYHKDSDGVAHRSSPFRDAIKIAEIIDKKIRVFEEALASLLEEMEEITEILGGPADRNIMDGLSLIWSPMEVVEPTRTITHRGFSSRRKRASEEGYAITHPHRHMIDGRIFSRSMRAVGGAVLIDVSGSMSLETEDVDKILDRCPGATVACYSGNGDVGRLKILAKGGKRIDFSDGAGSLGGNFVDLPALKWIAEEARRQKVKPIWISDGKAHASAGDTSEARVACARFCRDNGVIHYYSVEAYEGDSRYNSRYQSANGV